MASEDDDIALSLPQSPPAAPARREAAIGEALRRFDARGDAPNIARAGSSPRPAGSWWGIANRPQLGAVVAASLVAVIALPTAWLILSEETRPASELASSETEIRTFDVTEDAAPDDAEAAPKMPSAVSDSPRSASPADVAVNHGEERASQAVAPPRQEFAKRAADAPQALAAGEIRRADNAAPARSETAPAQALRPPRAKIVAPSPPVAAPPPPAAVMQEAPAARRPREDFAAADTRESIVVTGAARRGRDVPARGDWNACTIDDPKRSLAACKSLIDPAAKGIKGQAAAHLADGLSLAWQGNVDRAIAAFDRAIAIAPKSSLAYLNRGLAYQRQGNTDRALADLDRAVRLAPGSARGYYNRSLLLRARGDARRARADQARAVDLDADYEAVVD